MRLWRTRWQRAQLAALRLFLRALPAERRRVFALTMLAGVLCGLAAVAFHLSIRYAESRLINRAMSASGHMWGWWTVLTLTLGGLARGALLRYVVLDARGSGIPQVKVAYAVRGGKLSFAHATVGKFLIGALQSGSGALPGREGPTVQICAGIASLLGRAAALSRDNLKRPAAGWRGGRRGSGLQRAHRRRDLHGRGAGLNWTMQYQNNRLAVNPNNGAAMAYDAAGDQTHNSYVGYTYDATGQQASGSYNNLQTT